MADARQLRLDSERAFRLARAGCCKSFDELNDLGWNLQLQAQKVEREAQVKRNQELKRQLGSTSPWEIAAVTGFTSWSVSDNLKRTVRCISP